jgi:beta-lactamase superfamily II metal-dependent hydrolase
VFRIEFLPADPGDCIWITYGDPKEPRHILVDCGPPRTVEVLCERITNLGPPDKRTIELLIATHIDIDHIGGLVRLLADPPEGLKFGDIWFNGFKHLPRSRGTLGVRQAQEVSEALSGNDLPWNEAFGRGPAQVPDAGELPEKDLPGGMRLTLLSPNSRQLGRLATVWAQELAMIRRAAGPPRDPTRGGRLLGPAIDVAALAAARSREDRSEANGSSIVVLAEYEGRSLLLTGDAHADALIRPMDRLACQRRWDRIALHAYKVSHHGSDRSTSPSLLERVLADHYLVSTSGRVHGHPSPRTIARLLDANGRRKTLHFNYRTESTSLWDDRVLKRQYRYETCFPARSEGYLSLELR